MKLLPRILVDDEDDEDRRIDAAESQTEPRNLSGKLSRACAGGGRPSSPSAAVSRASSICLF